VPAAPRVARREDGGKGKDEPQLNPRRLVFPLATVLPLAGPTGPAAAALHASAPFVLRSFVSPL